MAIPVGTVLTHKMEKLQNAKLHMNCKLFALYLIRIVDFSCFLCIKSKVPTYYKTPLSTSSCTNSAILRWQSSLEVLTGSVLLVLTSWDLVLSEPTYKSGAWAESHTEIGIMSRARPNPYLPHRCISPCILTSEREIFVSFVPWRQITKISDHSL